MSALAVLNIAFLVYLRRVKPYKNPKRQTLSEISEALFAAGVTLLTIILIWRNGSISPSFFKGVCWLITFLFLF